MADRSRMKPAHKSTFSDRAEKRLSEPEPGMSRLVAHAIQFSATSITLTAAGLTLEDHPVTKLAVLSTSAVGSAFVGRAYERHGERRGREAGRQEGLEAGRGEGRGAALREMRERSLRSRFLPGRAHPGNRDRSGR